jgi:cell division protein FtsA
MIPQTDRARSNEISPRGRADVYAALDIGATRITCLVAIADPTVNGAMRLVGCGEARPHGFNNGIVSDLQKAERAIRMALGDAERMAGIRVDGLHVTISGPQLRGERVDGEANVSHSKVSPADVQTALDDARRRLRLEGRSLLHATPVGYAIDGVQGIEDPRGMEAQRVTAGIHVITAPEGVVSNVERVIRLAGADVALMVAGPYAAALGSLVSDERNNGSIVIELGASSTSISVFQSGHLQRLEVLSEGGAQVTEDLAAALNCTHPAAERVKLMHGSAVSLAAHGDDLVETPCLGDDGRLASTNTRRGEIADICARRMEGIVFQLGKRLHDWGYDRPRSRRVVLTGGGAEMPGMKELAARALQQQVRVGTPLRLMEAGGDSARPALATAAGLLRIAQDPPIDLLAVRMKAPRQSGTARGVISRAADWLRDFC